jgi:hypothetical protein
LKKKSQRSEIPSGVKRISVYGHYDTKVNALERILKTRVDGIKQHYWVRTGETEIRTFSGRFELYGTGRDLGEAVYMISDRLVPHPRKRFQVVSAKDFLTKPYKYARPGYWVTKEVES